MTPSTYFVASRSPSNGTAHRHNLVVVVSSEPKSKRSRTGLSPRGLAPAPCRYMEVGVGCTLKYFPRALRVIGSPWAVYLSSQLRSQSSFLIPFASKIHFLFTPSAIITRTRSNRRQWEKCWWHAMTIQNKKRTFPFDLSSGTPR